MAPIAREVRKTLWKAVAFIAFIVVADLWLTRQYGFGLAHLVAVSAVVAVVGGAVPFIRSILSTAEERAAARQLRDAGRVVLWTPLLVFLYLAGAIAALSRSYITVTGDGSDRADSVHIAYLDRPGQGKHGLLGPDSVLRFSLFATPLGRPIRISAPGFIAADFAVYPLKGLKVTLGQELPLAPSILFRPEPRALVALANGASFRAWTLPRTDASAVLAETSGVMSSFIVGEPRPLPGALLQSWQLELGCDVTRGHHKVLFAWSQPTPLRQRSVSPAPGTRLHAEVVARSGAVVARTEVTLGAEPLVDVPVLDSVPDASSCR